MNTSSAGFITRLEMQGKRRHNEFLVSVAILDWVNAIRSCDYHYHMQT